MLKPTPKQPPTVAGLLRKVLSIIEVEGQFCRGVLARTSDGRETTGDDSKAASVCLLGAFAAAEARQRRAHGWDAHPPEICWVAEGIVEDTARHVMRGHIGRGRVTNIIPTLNDEHPDGQAAVVRAVRNAIRRAERLQTKRSEA